MERFGTGDDKKVNCFGSAIAIAIVIDKLDR